MGPAAVAGANDDGLKAVTTGDNTAMGSDARPTTRLVWIDMEMTGLDAERDVILEIATVVTDAELNWVVEGPALVIRQDDSTLAAMDEWNASHHAESGLTERVRHSEVSVTEAEAVTLAFVERHCAPGTAPLCGNSIWQDRRFLAKYMPALNAYLHYRVVDVSTIKELARRWRPQLVNGLKKRNAHRAADDIRESIAELRYYRRHLFGIEDQTP